MQRSLFNEEEIRFLDGRFEQIIEFIRVEFPGVVFVTASELVQV